MAEVAVFAVELLWPWVTVIVYSRYKQLEESQGAMRKEIATPVITYQCSYIYLLTFLITQVTEVCNISL